MSEIKFGAQCPMCQQVFEFMVDTEKKAERGASMLHCPKCKTHPILNWITTYAVTNIKGINQYPRKEGEIKIVQEK